MNREQLGYFALAYQTHSFPAAAAQVPMSPQGFAKSIRTIEQELGVPLFSIDATGGRIPTGYADELMGYANKVDVGYTQLIEAFEGIKARENKTIRLATSLGIIGYLGVSCIEAFQQTHPDLRIKYSEMNDLICDQALRRGAYDMALTLAPFSSDFVTIEIHREPICFWVRRDDPLSSKSVLTVNDLHNQRISMPGEDIKCYGTLMGLMDEAGVEPGEITTSPEIFWHYQHALHGKGLGFTVDHLAGIDAFSQNPQVVAIPFEGFSWRIGLSYLPSHAPTDFQEEFYEFLLGYVKRRFDR
jgi:DNA-binding transcriptional LysR family regulator